MCARPPVRLRSARGWIPLVAALAGCSACSQAGRVAPVPEIALPGCETPAELAAELHAAARPGRDCADDLACWRDRLAGARAVRDRFAASYDAHRAYVLAVRAAARALGEDAVAPVREEYRALAAAHPDHPAYAHLRAQLELEGDAYAAELTRLATRFPDYPWVQLSLAFRAQAEAPAEVRLTARTGYDRFSTLCPGRLAERAAAVERVGDRELWSRDGAALRAAARASGDLETLARLWGLELRFAAVADRGTVRAGVGSEVAEIGAAPGLGPNDLRALLRGTEIAGDEEAKRVLEERLLAAEPCAEDATAIRARRRAEEPLPPDEGPVAARAARRRAIDAALALCPRDELALRQRVELLGESAQAEEAELLATLDRYLALPPRRTTPNGVPQFLAASYLAWGVRLERVPELLQDDRSRIEAELARGRASADPLAERRAGARWRENARLALRLALVRGELEAARHALDELAAATASAPGGGRQPALPGAAPLPDERTQLDRLRAELLVAEGRPQEALAVLERPLLDGVVGPSLETAARAAWRAANGGDAGYEAWIARSAAGIAPSEWRSVSRPLPGAPLASFSGGDFDWTALRGRTVLVAIWTSWCGSCAGQVEAMNRVVEAIGEGRDLAVVGILADRTAGEVVPFLATHDVGFEVLLGGDALFDEGLPGVPATWIVDPRGRVVRERLGYEGEPVDWARAALAEAEAVAAAASAASPPAAR